MADLLTAEQVDARRKAAGMSRAQLYARAGIAHTTFIRWKTGRTRPTIAVYERLIAAIERAEREPAA